MDTAQHIFEQRDGEVTKAYYAVLCACGVMGELAVALFRAQKTSERAKSYRRSSSRRASYEVKNWSLGEVCRILSKMADCDDCQGTGNFYRNDVDGDFLPCDTCQGKGTQQTLRWGWKHDPKTPGYEWVLYVDLPSGQVSFHSAIRLSGPDYHGEYDGQKLSRQRILAFCDAVLTGDICPEIDGPKQPSNASADSSRCGYQGQPISWPQPTLFDLGTAPAFQNR